ncbi:MULTISPECIES: penicillin-binding protein 2 [Gardnerella]|uniref:Putative penicillin-binding protein A n=1 Tax=Gardnerella vaginalis TaxID=2702 RepID=A0A135Z5F1_GARVA|nr:MULTISPECIES: penicillin-binding transpeptidase domain-containing protein [Gardnerella]KXI16885.1 putative penicillin-binding protein A [Gardnerella vaginalis]PNP88615.1 penicillin-binding protein [Gardnerella sp. KA00735]
MNKCLKQLFATVVILFVILGISSMTITSIRANALNSDPRNRRALYNEFGAPRGSILASDGTILAKSEPSKDAFAYQRYYTQGTLYAPITGYFSISQRADRGIEASRNELLSGDSHALFWQKFKSLFTGVANKGASIETSIDPKLQKLAYELLKDKDGALVAIEPKTGKIRAMVSTPSYDPSNLALHNIGSVNSSYNKLTSDVNNPMLNRAISELYAPGSIFKTVVAAAALESGKYQPDSIIPAGSSYILPGTKTSLMNVVYQANGNDGKISLEDALAYSSNTAFAQLGVSLGADAITQQAKKFGFFSSITVDGSDSTGFPMRAVTSRIPIKPTPDKLAIESIGQGDVVVTPLQAAMVASAIANKGVLMKPTLVDCVRSSDLSVLSQTKPTVMSEVMSADNAVKLTNMMQSVVTKGNPHLSLPNIPVASKTGTAQIGVHKESLNGWVIGFAPAQDPKIAIAVVIHNSHSFGTVTAGPIMQKVMKEALTK